MEELKRIMIVEDDEDIQEIVKLSLSLIGGFSVFGFTSGEDALNNVLKVKPQLILLDVMMPSMDGPTTLKKMKLMPEAAQIPVFFITAKVQPYEIESYEKMGVLGVISKPFDPMTLSQLVLQLWKKK